MGESMEIRVVLDGPLPVYRQIVDTIRGYCVSGQLEPGMKLPTVRELAASLGVHFNTVAVAYRVLADEGWIQVLGRKGALVEYRERPATPDAKSQAAESGRLRNLIAELRGKGFGKDWILKEVQGTLEARH